MGLKSENDDMELCAVIIYLGIGIQQPLVKIIRDSASVLNLTNHILNSSP